ncbi:MAG: class II aldolase/adducin family protein, partial [Candidatus Cloacimonetes bacterium]|nr:class II aldolase/adducin family protein [Candidatus Cloacimonadota bacterium]
QVSKVNLQDELVYACGLREPSSETLVHYCIYQARPEINAIFHGHCQLILDKAGELNLPETAVESAYGTHELAEAVLQIINQHNFLIMKNHGFLSLGKTMQEAGNSILTILGRSEKCL